MKLKFLILLLLCLPILTACYRQTDEPFQQVDSAEVVSVLTPTSIQDLIEAGEDQSGEDAEASAETRQYITPEALPGQVEQPTIDVPTEIPVSETAPPLTATAVVRASATLAFEEALDPNHECVYSVQSGDNLYRLSLTWGTTVDAIMDASQLDDDSLSIGQLLLRPGCDYAPPAPQPTAEPQPTVSEPEAVDEAAELEVEVEAENATVATPEASSKVHVVSAGETIESISLKYRVDVNRLVAMNNLSNPNRLLVGQELFLPE